MAAQHSFKKLAIVLALGLLCLFSGCTQGQLPQEALCNVVLQNAPHVTAKNEVCQIKAGEDAQFILTLDAGYQLDSVSYPEHTLAQNGQEIVLTLHNVRYTESVLLTTTPTGVAMLYHANGGQRQDGGNSAVPVQQIAPNSHLRQNTSLGSNLFVRSGFVQTGWNTQPDGSGVAVGLGSRIALPEGAILYAQWSAQTPDSAFSYQIDSGAVTITGYTGKDSTVTIPEQIEGLLVVALGAGALANASCETLILPAGITRLEAGCCANSAIKTLYLFDSIATLSDACFAGCSQLATLHINAAEAPVYSGNYFDTFQDKLDRLALLAAQQAQKLVLFSGSPTRFGFDCEALQQAMPQHSVVNMGVFAYTNALPQLEIITAYLQPEDILLHAPEFDAAPYQFCSTNKLDAAFFCMMESNYDAIALLDLRNYSQVFSALNTYLYQKSEMQGKSYAVSAADYDEDGNWVQTPSYNLYGDYVLPRPNAEADAPVYGYPASYTVESFPYGQYLAPLNAVYQQLLQAGVRVYFTYAPRNEQALSPQSTPDTRRQLDEYLRQNLAVPVISNIEDSLYPGRYLYGTDNHLSTEGVALRTQRILADLAAQQQAESEVPHA